MDKFEVLHVAKEKLIAEIREYVLSCKEDWRRVPWLALQADGGYGLAGACEDAYIRGIWTLKVPSFYYQIFVDCATGTFVERDFRPAKDREVSALVSHLNQLDVTKVIRGLEEKSKENTLSKDRDVISQWRERVAKKLKLGPLYIRPKAKKAR